MLDQGYKLVRVVLIAYPSYDHVNKVCCIICTINCNQKDYIHVNTK
ncbi:hypothetical protein KMU_13010 [Proteus vulgaris]|nr:hypothetical protein KMU_13010 [Proteus vulgaris]